MPMRPTVSPRSSTEHSPTATNPRAAGRVRRTVVVGLSIITLLFPVSTSALATHGHGSDSRPSAADGRIPGWETHDKTNNSSMDNINSKIINSVVFWNRGYTGDGVTVALIDTGVVLVDGLRGDGKVVNGPDLSFDGPNEDLRSLDLFGHGTHIAGIIAGRDDSAPPEPNPGSGGRHFLGVAPDAQILNIKVGDAVGSTEVSQVIAALKWVVDHRTDAGMNVRVINLAYGIDAATEYQVDDLAYAVEAAWRAGIVVVVAAGNDGNDHALRNPAFDPYVLAVGAVDTKGTQSPDDDTVPTFSNCGTEGRPVDVLAPGVSVISLRDPGSFADFFFPDARVGERFVRGTGTSQAAAIVSGAAALLIEQRPELSPDQVKALLVSTARPIPSSSAVCGEAGLVDLKSLLRASTPATIQTWPMATNSGSYDGLVVDGGWDGQTWGGQTWGGQTWGGQTWGGQTWGGQTWGGQTWGGQTWGGQTWGGQTWGGQSWGSYLWN
jgi:subtilisin family serine protease